MASKRTAAAVLVLCTVVAAVLVSIQYTGGIFHAERTELLTVEGVYLGRLRELGLGQAAPDFPGEAQWLNTEGSHPPTALRGGAMSMRLLRREGKLVLLHFWDYTNLESLMTLSTLRGWHNRYSEYGVEIIGVHRGQYPFARKLLHVARAVQRLGIQHAVVNDEHGDISTAYGTEKIPNMFLVGPDGTIIAEQQGLQHTADMELQLCKAAAAQHPELWCGPKELRGSATETFLALVPVLQGTDGGKQQMWAKRWLEWIKWRMHRFECWDKSQDMDVGTGGVSSLTHLQHYAEGIASFTDLAGVPLGDGKFVLSGQWESDKQAVVVHTGEAGMVDTHIRVRYHGRDVYAVLGLQETEAEAPDFCANGLIGTAEKGSGCLNNLCKDVAGERGITGWCETSAGRWGGCTHCKDVSAVKVYMLVDGQPVKSAVRGDDVQEDALGRTFVAVREPRLYSLIAGAKKEGHCITFLPSQEGVVFHHFTFTADCSSAGPQWLHQLTEKE